MKINWGTKLVFFALAFMSFVVFMVVRIVRTDVPLVEEHYYEKGLKYQKEIDNSSRIDTMVQFNVTSDADPQLIILNISSVDFTSAHLTLYRPSDPGKDKEIDINLPSKKVFNFPLKSLEKGKWRLKLKWVAGGEEFNLEKQIGL